MGAVTQGQRTKGKPLRVRIVLNLPFELAVTLKSLAERERRPLTTQVEILVERALSLTEEPRVAA